MDLAQSGRDPSPARSRTSSHLSQHQPQFTAQPQQNPSDYTSLDPSLLQNPLFADDSFANDYSQPNAAFDLNQADQFFDLNAASDPQFNNFLTDQSQELGIPSQGHSDGQMQFPAFDDSSLNSLLQQQNSHLSNTGLLDPNNIPYDTHNHSPTPPHLLSSSTAISSRSTSPRATPSPQQSYAVQPTRSRNTSESLDPSSAAYPHGHNFGSDWAAGAAFRGHRRKPSDAVSDVSTHSNQASPYIGHMDNMDQNISPMLPAQSDVHFSNDAFGFTNFTLNDQNFGSNERLSPVPSLQNSPRLPLDQQPLPTFTANDNFGLSQNLSFQQPGNNSFNAFPDMQMFDNAPFPNIDVTGADSFEGHADTMSPPEINIQFAPPSRQPSFGPRNRAASTNELIPPDAMRRKRSKSDPFAGGNRPASPGISARGRSPSLHTGTPGAATLSPATIPVPASRSPSPSARNRSSSAASDSRQYLLDLADPERATGGAGEQKRQKHPSNYACTLCTKRFTRAYNLRSHLRTHTDERPFVCTICNKAFARQHDRKRHEGLHSGEKKFVCKGDLKNGESWGCSRRFARADALGRHFRSEAGRECIKPLLDEEATERRAAWLEEQRQHQLRSQQGFVAPLPMTDMPQPGPQLPAVLLQMYPDLASFNFGQPIAGGALAEDPEDDYGSRGSFDASSGGEYMSDNDMGTYDHMQMDGQDASFTAQPGNWP